MKHAYLPLLLIITLNAKGQNVGINVPSPVASLEVKGSNNVNANSLLVKTFNSDTVLTVKNNATVVMGSKTSGFGQLSIINDGKLEPTLLLQGINSIGSGRYHGDMQMGDDSRSRYFSLHSLVYGPASGNLNNSANALLTFNTDSLASIFSLSGTGRASIAGAPPVGLLNIKGDWQNNVGPYNFTPHINLVGTGTGNRSYISFSSADAAHYWRLSAIHAPSDISLSNFNIGFDEQTEPKFTIQGTGDVVIGTGTGGGKLSINQTAGTLTPTLALNNGSDIANPSSIKISNGVGSNSWLIKGFTDQVNNLNSRFKLTNSVTGDALSISGDGKVGIGTINPAEQLEVNGKIKITGGSPGAGKVLTSDATGSATWSTLPGTIATTLYGENFVTAPAAAIAFISATASAVISATTQKVVITATAALGSSTGGTLLNIYPAYKLSTGAVTTIGGGIFNLTCVAGQRNTYTIHAVVSNLSPGTYSFGMAGSCNNASWNNNEYSYVTIMVIN